MPLRSLTLGLLAATAMLAPLPTARAADLDENYGYAEAPQEVPVVQSKVEFGTGWYVRGDIGVTRLPGLRPVDLGVGNAPTFDLGNGSKVGYTAALGGGYQLNRWLRSDLTADFNEPVKTSSNTAGVFCPTGIYYDAAGNRQETNGGCIGTDVAKITSFDVLVNGYFDIGTWSIVTPYVGAGVGLAFGHVSTGTTYIQGANNLPYDVTFSDPKSGASYYNNYNRYGSSNYYNFAFALMAGVAIDVLPHTKLDIGYRFLDLGRVYGATLYQHQVRAGLRYMIDN